MTTISKSDFLIYCDAHRHLWASKHGLLECEVSDFDEHLIDEGYAVENLAGEYLQTVLLSENPTWKILPQQTFKDGRFEARTDFLVFQPETNTYDLYEVKSATSPDKKDAYDVAYQYLILQHQIKIDHVYILHLNKDYVRTNNLVDLSQLFIADDLTELVIELLPGIAGLREEALVAAEAPSAFDLPHCLAPKDCPCPNLCHPNLPEFSIYDIPRLSAKKKAALLDMGILDARLIPDDFDLNSKQQLIAERAKTNSEYVNLPALKNQIGKLQFPLWFLDYETCICAIPRFDGYHPQQQVVFQYSLHKLDEVKSEPHHKGFIAIDEGDPSIILLKQLSEDLGEFGNVIVWNKAFEMTMNREMAKLHPKYAAFLENLNSRIYDLGEIVNLGIYIHPRFKGSWSIKNVLPVMVPELSYENLHINKGDKASMAWWNITFGNIDFGKKSELLNGLDKYCELDTLAMVEIFRKLTLMI